MTAASLPLLFQRVSRPTPGRVKPRALLTPVVAGDAVLVAGAIFLEQRDLLGAERGRLGAAGAEDAARGRRQRPRQITLPHPAALRPPLVRLGHRLRPEPRQGEGVARGQE